MLLFPERNNHLNLPPPRDYPRFGNAPYRIESAG